MAREMCEQQLTIITVESSDYSGCKVSSKLFKVIF